MNTSKFCLQKLKQQATTPQRIINILVVILTDGDMLVF